MAAPQTRAQFKDYCLDNKYSKWYFSLIEKAETRNWSKKTANCYVEGHHILGKKWYHNKLTKQEKYFIAGQQTENFILGRLKDV